jgi:hypothetical protein
MEIQPIIVTALFDIKREDWKHHQQSINGYIHWMERMLSIKNRMVIYTQDDLRDNIKEKRDLYFDDTHYVVDTKEQLLASQLHYTQLNTLMSSDEFKNKVHFPQVPEMSEIWYNILMFNKVWWMLDASERVDGTHYVWVDAGCFREDIINKEWPSKDKMRDKPLFFSHNLDFELNNGEEWHCLSQVRNIQGTCFVIPKKDLEDIATQFYHKVTNCIKQGYIGSDEKILDLLYLDNIDKWDLYKCGWREYLDILS